MQHSHAAFWPSLQNRTAGHLFNQDFGWWRQQQDHRVQRGAHDPIFEMHFTLFTIEFWTVNEIELLVFADLLVSTNRWPNAGWVACCFLWSQEKGWYHLLSFTVIHYTWVWLQLPAPLAKSSHAHTDLVSSLLKLNFPSSSCQKLNRKTLHQRVCVHLWQTLSRCTGKLCTHTQRKVQLSPKHLKQNVLEHVPDQDHFSSWLSQVERISGVTIVSV